MDENALLSDSEIVDFQRGLSDTQKARIIPVATVSSEKLLAAQRAFASHSQDSSAEEIDSDSLPNPCIVYEHKDFKGQSMRPVSPSHMLFLTPDAGLRLLPSFLPPECQVMLLNRILHRDLSNPVHKTNLHIDYTIPFPPSFPGTSQPASFFTCPQQHKLQIFEPLNPHSNHKPLKMSQFLQKKLRWLTLGDQYNWNTRSYPSESPAPFPADIAALVTSLFEDSFTPESGVVLLYSPKDYMPVHRDVSEECERGLASFSLGCDGLFIIARDKFPGEDERNEDREQEMIVIRVRSGDVVQMGGETRFAWHAMPKVLAGTCPLWLHDWPAVKGAENKEYEKWKGYMKGKRLNISCRQVWS